ncbi:MAG TPA: HEAT repeat domain-containing protein [Nostoc sp.]|uniref:HEAT repeat domain-containing protein n=1 Tax=Nostoc sp. TaxID=1180 RepID=UPI002D720DF0|nr:HEAT repeat domain-containing protein [Nostoc sp.]HYX16826.1 HEAT repeat domain-containing protein [Nostoc sp.]
MLDWLAYWGVTQAAGFIFKPILEDLAKDAAKDWAKDLLKGIPGNILEKLKKEDIEIAAGKALKEFLQLVQEDLKGGELSEDEIKKYTQPIKQFLKNQEVKELLGNAFKDNNPAIDTNKLQEIWDKINVSNPLPDDFNWKRVAKKYLQKVKEIIQGIPELRDILDSQNLDKIKYILESNAQKITTFDLVKYQEGIRECYGNLKLDSLDTSGYAYNELKLWRIFTAQNVRETHQVLAQVHELPKEHLRRLRESDQVEAVELEELERHKRVYFEQPIRCVLDVVNKKQDYKYIVILGDPGSGKSTLLQFLALNWAESPLDNVISLPIPLLIELRTYMRRREDKECNNFLEFFHQGSGAIHHLNQLELDKKLKAGNALLMFDGLDEVFDPGKREDVITDIHRFTNDYPDVQVIVTSRIIGYKPQRLLNAEFRHFILQDLDLEQIQDFIYRWHELTFTDAVDKVRKRERLQRGIEASKSIAELAGNPLLLTMMAILNLKGEELPRNRIKLYEEVSKLLLHNWDNKRNLKPDKKLKYITFKDKEGMLRQVAYKMQTREKTLAGNIINKDDLEEIFTTYMQRLSIPLYKAKYKAERLKEQLKTRNFMLCFVGADYYAFVHRTFLEYFCAWEFVWQFKETRTLSIEELKNEVFGKHWQDESWHEVLRLIAGSLESKFAGDIIEHLIETFEDGLNEGAYEEKLTDILFLASDCILDVKNRSTITVTDNKLLNYLKKVAEYYVPYSSEDVANLFTDTDQANLIVKINTKVVSVITTTWSNHVETLPWLKTLAMYGLNGKDGDIPAMAVRELVRGWKNDPDTLPILKSLAKPIHDTNNTSAYAAIQELARGWRDDPEILPMLKSLTQFREDRNIQTMAVQELARGWKDDPETLPMLESLAQSSNDSVVQSTVVKQLTQGWKNQLNILSFVLSLLKKPAQLDNFGYIKHEVMEELIKSWQTSPEIYNFLCECAVDDSFNPIFLDFSTDSTSNRNQVPSRQIALEAIIEQYPHPQHPQTLPLLRDRAKNDPDEKVREYAQKKLAQLEK